MAFYRCTAAVKQSGDLPAGYIKCAYLKSTGTQYINLPFGFDNTDEIYTDFSIDVNGKDNYIISPIKWNNSNNRFAMGVHAPNSKYLYTCAYGNQLTGATALRPNTDNDFNIHAWEYKNYIYRMSDLNLALSCTSFTFGGTTANLRLFYGYNSNTQGKVASYKHIKNGEIVCNLIPCLNASGTPCMYDTATKTTYYNNGTGTFEYALA